MHYRFFKWVCLLIGLLLTPLVSRTQPISTNLSERISEVDTFALAHNAAISDSLNQIADSLEASLLWTVRTYPQVERLLVSLSPNSPNLGLLPCVLPVALPLDAFRVSSPFGFRKHPVHQQIRFHGGVDVSVPAGIPVHATAAGIVKGVGYNAILGVFVQLQHAFGFETLYGHLEGYCVRPGQVVSRHQELGRSGQTGLSTGPHLHYVIKKNGAAVDPFAFCFLLRRRLWLYQRSKSAGNGAAVSAVAKGLSAKGE